MEHDDDCKLFVEMWNESEEFRTLMLTAKGATPKQIKIAADFLNDRKTGKFLTIADTAADTKADFVVRVQDDSMVGMRIHGGDWVFIQQQSEVENGDIAAVVIGDDKAVHLTRFYRYDDIVILHPENPDYQETVYTGTDSNAVRILGKAVAFQSKLSRK